jgi:parallel beta-helix repeat protein
VNDNVPRNTYSGSAIAVDGSDQVVVRNNIADRNNGNGILIEDGTNVLVEGNRARFNIGDLGSWGTAGIWIDGGHTVTVRGNWFEGNLWAGIFATDETPSDPYGYEIYNNVSIGNGSGIWLDGIGQAGKPLDLVYNNTFVDNTVVGVKLVNRGVSQVTHTRVYDNIVAQMNTDRPALAVNAGTYPDVVLDRNLYFRQGSTKPISWWFEPGRSFDTTPSSVADRAFAEYQALSGWDASGLAANPLFVGPGAEDYHLLAASPAIDAGSSLFPAPSDYDGHARPLGAGPDIGALEGSGPCAAGACIAGTPPSSAYDSALRPINPVSITIPQGATSVTKLLNVAVRNGDVSPRDLLGHRIQLLADDGDCPAGTVTGIPAFRYMGGAFRSPESSNFIKGGRTLPAQVKLTIDRAAFASVSDCTLQLTVKTPVPGNVDPVPGNDSVGVELNVSAH